MCHKCQETIKTFYVLYIITAVRSVDMKKWDRCINGKVKLNKTRTRAQGRLHGESTCATAWGGKI